MITPNHVRTMARYNAWQNTSLYREANALGDAARRLDRGAFFSSIHATLSHIMWADMAWMHRFAAMQKPEGGIATSTTFYPAWADMHRDRVKLDAAINDWAGQVTEAWLADDITWYSGARGKDMTRPNWLIVTHFFNHQTHHRGQVHAMITAAGGKPDMTDVIFMDD